MTTSSNSGTKHLISKDTQAYLEQLEAEEKAGKVNGEPTYTHHPDALDQLIQSHNVRIVGLSFYPEVDLVLVVLNNRKVMKRALSDFGKLQGAPPDALARYELSRYGVHWPALDEDLSLKGFLQHELMHTDLARVV